MPNTQRDNFSTAIFSAILPTSPSATLTTLQSTTKSVKLNTSHIARSKILKLLILKKIKNILLYHRYFEITVLIARRITQRSTRPNIRRSVRFIMRKNATGNALIHISFLSLFFSPLHNNLSTIGEQGFQVRLPQTL